MAAIDNISLDKSGAETRCRSAIALHLTRESTVSRIEQLQDWEFEVRRGSGFLVARKQEPLDRESLLRIGYEQAERFLDIISFENSSTAEIGAPGRSHVILYDREGKLILERLATSDQPMSMQLEITRLGLDGQAEPPPPAPPAKWIPALRFYRLSQASRSPHEAYRNLWLGFEALLSAAVPKGQKEKEGVWLRRALGQIVRILDVTHEISDGKDPVDYLMERHYAGMRCNLFHAKIGALYTTPQMPTAQEALDAYAEIVRIWRAIAIRVGELRFVGSGLVTYAGYANHMAAVFSQVNFHATDDAALPAVTDVAVSPNGHEIVTFDSSGHIGVVAPGRVENRGIIDVSSRPQLPPFHRITTSIGDILYSIDHMAGGIDMDGVDHFEYRQMWRLLNTGVPRTYFD
jgi:hypothetical protein